MTIRERALGRDSVLSVSKMSALWRLNVFGEVPHQIGKLMGDIGRAMKSWDFPFDGSKL
jgi:hypothetical protein